MPSVLLRVTARWRETDGGRWRRGQGTRNLQHRDRLVRERKRRGGRAGRYVDRARSQCNRQVLRRTCRLPGCRDEKELEFFIKKWCGYPMSYPILHIGFRGSEEVLHLCDESEDDQPEDDQSEDDDSSRASLKEIRDWMGALCENRIVHFSSCSVLRGADVKPLLRDNGFSPTSATRSELKFSRTVWRGGSSPTRCFSAGRPSFRCCSADLGC